MVLFDHYKQSYVLKVSLNAMVGGKLSIRGLISSSVVTTACLMSLCDVNGIEFTK